MVIFNLNVLKWIIISFKPVFYVSLLLKFWASGFCCICTLSITTNHQTGRQEKKLILRQLCSWLWHRKMGYTFVLVIDTLPGYTYTHTHTHTRTDKVIMCPDKHVRVSFHLPDAVKIYWRYTSPLSAECPSHESRYCFKRQTAIWVLTARVYNQSTTVLYRLTVLHPLGLIWAKNYRVSKTALAV